LLHFILYLSLVLFFISIAKAVYFSFKTLFPDNKVREDSGFFFGSIANKGVAKFKKEFLNSKDDEIIEDINNQTFINSTIATAKFTWLKKSIVDTLIASALWIISLVFIAYLK